jgi:hypothetical protein
LAISVLVLSVFVLQARAAGPTITVLVPTAAPVGATLLITGSGFGATPGSSTVSVGGKTVSTVYSWSATQIQVVIPSGATTGNVNVTIAGTKSNNKSLTIVSAPAITSIAPNPSSVGTSVTITGTHLKAGGGIVPTVWFYQAGSCPTCGYAANPTSSTDGSVVVQVPPGAITGNVDVNVDGADSNPLSFTLTGTRAPVANAGLEDTVAIGSTVRLDGAGSYDTNGQALPLTYQWSFNSIPTGSHAVLTNTTSPFPTFVPDVAGDYYVQLIVNNGTLASAPSFAYIETSNSYTQTGVSFLTANAGPDQTVTTGSTVQLDASGSYDSDGLQISYQWYLWYLSNASGSQWLLQGTAPLSNANTLNPTFVASTSGTYFAVLWVTDGYGATASDVVKISNVNSQPIASAGTDQSIQAPQTVQLDGTGSTDVDGNALPTTYHLQSYFCNSAKSASFGIATGLALRALSPWTGTLQFGLPSSWSHSPLVPFCSA